MVHNRNDHIYTLKPIYIPVEYKGTDLFNMLTIFVLIYVSDEPSKAKNIITAIVKNTPTRPN